MSEVPWLGTLAFRRRPLTISWSAELGLGGEAPALPQPLKTEGEPAPDQRGFYAAGLTAETVLWFTPAGFPLPPCSGRRGVGEYELEKTYRVATVSGVCRPPGHAGPVRRPCSLYGDPFTGAVAFIRAMFQ